MRKMLVRLRNKIFGSGQVLKRLDKLEAHVLAAVNGGQAPANRQQKNTTPAASEEFVPSGHYYSAVPSIDEIRAAEDSIWVNRSRPCPGIDLHIPEQLKTAAAMAMLMEDQPYSSVSDPSLRYSADNTMFGLGSAILLNLLIRHIRPKRIIEIGSGYSSAVMLDTNERYMDSRMQLLFIEPYPDRLNKLMRPTDKSVCKLIPSQAQTVSLEHFEALESDDILFVDSSHVSKLNSDVNRILFEILPALKPGVIVHFHDIYYPFIYPKDWVYGGRAWNEAYILRAFLQFNSSFEVFFWGSALHLCAQPQIQSFRFADIDSSSLWIRKVPS